MTQPTYACRSCAAAACEPVLSFGSMPLANAYLRAEDLVRPEERFPLDVVFCTRCALLQLAGEVPPGKLFSEYLYFSSFSDTMVEHAGRLVEQVLAKTPLGPSSLVVEVASNDGYLLRHYQSRGIPVLGVEPAENVARVAKEKGVPTLVEFFGVDSAEKIASEHGRADVIHAHNVLAHVPDLNGFVRGLRDLLKDEGLIVIEAPYVRDLINRCEFDTIYHEHLCYFSLAALEPLLDRHGLALRRVERVPIHGGSLRLWLSRKEAGGPDESVAALREAEREAGLDRLSAYRTFGRKVEALRDTLIRFLRGLHDEGRRIAAYGAAAKGTVLLNYAGLGGDLLEFVADRSPHKQGRFVPGVRIPILPPEQLLERRPDYVLLLVWNIAPEVLRQQTEYRNRGGKFIIPIPNLEVV